MHATPLEEKIQGMITPSLQAMGYVPVLVRLREGGKRALEIMAERADEQCMSLDDCTAISHAVSALMDVEDPISGAYQLEVSSPGLDRPLVTLADFVKYTGFEAKVETALTVEGRKRFKGVIASALDETVTMTVDGVNYALPYANIRTAKLVLTQALMAAYLKKSEG